MVSTGVGVEERGTDSDSGDGDGDVDAVKDVADPGSDLRERAFVVHVDLPQRESGAQPADTLARSAGSGPSRTTRALRADRSPARRAPMRGAALADDHDLSGSSPWLAPSQRSL
jgi:hypothetical protein